MKCPLRLRTQKRPLGEAAFGVPERVEDFNFSIISSNFILVFPKFLQVVFYSSSLSVFYKYFHFYQL